MFKLSTFSDDSVAPFVGNLLKNFNLCFNINLLQKVHQHLLVEGFKTYVSHLEKYVHNDVQVKVVGIYWKHTKTR